MNLRASVNLAGLERRFSALVAAASDPKTALLRCGGVVRSHSERTFATQGPGWAPLAPATMARKLDAAQVAFLAKTNGKRASALALALDRKMNQTRLAVMRARTEAATIRAQGRLRSQEGAAAALELAFASKRLSSFAAMVAFAQKDRERARKHGAAMKAAREAFKAGQITAEEKRRIAAQGKRRQIASTGSAAQMLGNLDKSIAMALTGPRQVSIFSKSRIGGVHNVGGTAGHGAKIPARPFMYIPDNARPVFAEIVTEELTDAFVTG